MALEYFFHYIFNYTHLHSITLDSMKEKRKTYVFLLPAFAVAMATTYFVASVCNKPQLT